MGFFSYICPVCGKNIRTGEKCVLIHKRDGVEIGRTEGHYDSYGRVEEDNVFRGESGPNSHKEICDSEFRLDSSYRFGRMRILPNGQLLDSDVISSFVKEYILAHTFLEKNAASVWSFMILSQEITPGGARLWGFDRFEARQILKMGTRRSSKRSSIVSRI